ncbi:MAG: hypothetical protein ACR2HC_02400 [Thermoleophilaceae bacterium]
MRISLRASGAVVVAAGLIALSGCGGDDEKASTAPRTDTATIGRETATSESTAPDAIERTDATTPAQAETGGGGTGGAKSPEDQPGGAGDEVPNSVPAQITGRGGKVFPGSVSVPPFIAITVVLRGVDNTPYELRGGGKTVKSGQSVTFDGLRAGKRLVLRGPQGNVVISANAEPGP